MKKNGIRKHSLILLFVGLIGVCYFVFSMIRLSSVIKAKQNEAESLSQAYQQQQIENEEKRRILADGNEKELIEKYARENRGYVYPDERVYYDITPGG